MIKVGIIGGAGYTAGELIRLLINHPDVEIAFVNSSSNAGNKITDVHEGLFGETDLRFTSELPLDEIDCLSSVPRTATRRSSWRAMRCLPPSRLST